MQAGQTTMESLDSVQRQAVSVPTAKLTSSSSPIVKFLKDSTAGTIGGIAVTLVGHPFGMLSDMHLMYATEFVNSFNNYLGISFAHGVLPSLII